MGSRKWWDIPDFFTAVSENKVKDSLLKCEESKLELELDLNFILFYFCILFYILLYFILFYFIYLLAG